MNASKYAKLAILMGVLYVPIGYPPRILFFCYHVWLVIIAI